MLRTHEKCEHCKLFVREPTTKLKRICCKISKTMTGYMASSKDLVRMKGLLPVEQTNDMLYRKVILLDIYLTFYRLNKFHEKIMNHYQSRSESRNQFFFFSLLEYKQMNPIIDGFLKLETIFRCTNSDFHDYFQIIA